MCLLIVDADTQVFKACMIAEKTVYDILPLAIRDIPTEKVIDTEDYETYQQYVIQSFSYVSEYKTWLKDIGKDTPDFLRVSRVTLEPLSHALHVLDTMIKETIKVVEPDHTILLLTGDNNFRDDVAKLRVYKETRRDKPKPHHYTAARKHLVDKYNAKIIDGCEADDMCGILATECIINSEPYVIASVDKDLKSIPGMHYNYDKKIWKHISVHEAEHWFWFQVLAGDTTDCIPGLYKIGEVSANKILGKARSYNTMYTKVKDAYETAFKKDKQTTTQRYARYRTSDELLQEQARLIHMQRYVGEMWTAPGSKG